MFAMKRVHLFAGALVALAALVIGCAGSNGDNPSSTDGDIITGTPRIEAVVVVDRSNLKDPSKYTDSQLQDPTQVNPADLIDEELYGVQDPRDIQTQEEYYFQLVYYENDNPAGIRHIIANDGIEWTTSNVNGLYGQIGINSGLFVAPTRVTHDDQFIFAQYKNRRYEVRYEIHPRQIRLIGFIKTEESVPVKGVNLFFYDQNNSVVGEVASAYDGRFRASVPTSAVKFAPSVDSIPTQFYQSFLFNDLRYTIGVAQCKAPLPEFSVGTKVLDDNILLRTRVEGQPTPDPTGCEG